MEQNICFMTHPENFFLREVDVAGDELWLGTMPVNWVPPKK